MASALTGTTSSYNIKILPLNAGPQSEDHAWQTTPRKHNGSRLLAMENGDSEYVFVSYRGGEIGKERIRREVRKAAVKAGVVEDVDEKRWHYKFVSHYYRTIFTSLMRNSEPGMKDHWVAYLRGDSDQRRDNR